MSPARRHAIRAVREIDLDALGEAFACVRWPIIVAAVINFCVIACKAIAWRFLLGERHPVPVIRLFNYTLSACAASVILPLFGGELIKRWLLRNRDGFSSPR